MSQRFFRGGRQFLQQFKQHQQKRATSQLIMGSAAPKFAITFTSPAAMLAQAMSHSAPIMNALGGAVGSAAGGRTLTTTTTTTSSSGGCGSPSCCQGMTSITSGEDGEEPFIGAPSLSSSLSNNQNQNTSRGVTASISVTDQSQLNQSTNSTSSCKSMNQSPAVAANPTAAAATSPTPAPRVKCDPYEQGGHPLATAVVQQHMTVTLDPAWSYDEPKKILVRSFEFGRIYRDQYSQPNEDTRRLFAFIADLGKIQEFGAHPIYNININLRANSVQVMLRTVSLGGISYQDLMLGTKLDGIWFRLMMEKEAKVKQLQKAQASKLKPDESKQSTSTISSSPKPRSSQQADQPEL